HDVENDRRAEAEQQDAAQHHQHGFERIERAPLQVTLPLEDQSVSDRHVDSPDGACREAWRTSAPGRWWLASAILNGLKGPLRLRLGRPRGRPYVMMLHPSDRLKQSTGASTREARRQPTPMPRIRFVIFTACGPSSADILSR